MWSRRFRARQSIRGSLWVLPLLAALLGVALAAVAVHFQDRLESPSGWGYSAGTAQTVLTTIVASAVGLTGFVVTVSVLVVQMATGTFSPRYMRLWFRDRALRGVLAVSVGTVTFAFSLLRRIEENQVPDLAVTFAGFLLGAALVLFLVFFDRVLHRMRPVKVAALVARAGRRTVERAGGGAPASGGRRGRGARRRAAGPGGPQPSSRRDPGHRPAGGRAVGRRAPGASWSSGTPWATSCRPAGPSSRSTGPWRTPRAPSGGCGAWWRSASSAPSSRTRPSRSRILVNIAIRALSPAVNDPTTAVQVLDHLEDVLAVIGRTPGLGGNWEYRDDAGALRMVIPVPAMGGPAGARRHRDPGVRRAVDPGGAPAAGDAGGAPPDGASRVRARDRRRAGQARSGRGEDLRVVARRRPREDARPPGHRRAAATRPLRRLRPPRGGSSGRARTAARWRAPRPPGPPRTPRPPTRGWCRPRRPGRR